MKEKTLRSTMTIVGVALCGTSVGMARHAGFGTDPFTVMVTGLDNSLHLGYGIIFTALAAMLLVGGFPAETASDRSVDDLHAASGSASSSKTQTTFATLLMPHPSLGAARRRADREPRPVEVWRRRCTTPPIRASRRTTRFALILADRPASHSASAASAPIPSVFSSASSSVRRSASAPSRRRYAWGRWSICSSAASRSRCGADIPIPTGSRRRIEPGVNRYRAVVTDVLIRQKRPKSCR